MIKMAKRTVEKNGHRRTIFIPVDGTDKLYDDEVIETEVLKTEEELSKLPAKKLVKPTDKNAVSELNERAEWRTKRQEGRRVFGGITLGR